MTDFSGEPAAPSTADSSAVDAPAEDAPTESRPGIPVWRVGKPDAFLAADIATARNAVASIAAAEDIGAHVGARSEGVRCVTHLFESRKPGYQGWVWFATLARISRGKGSTVNEVGLLPTEDAVLAPAWVPWSERVRPEDREDDAGAQNHADAPGAHDGEDVDAQGDVNGDDVHDDDGGAASEKSAEDSADLGTAAH